MDDLSVSQPRKRSSTKVIMEQQLDSLRKLVRHLPFTLDEPAVSRYDFSSLREEEIEDYGNEPAALVHRMEEQLGHLKLDSAHRLSFQERGAGPCSAVDFLELYFLKHPNDILIQNWITGLLTYVKTLSDAVLDDSESNDAGVRVCVEGCYLSRN
jgi:hypothetical protein